MVLSQYPSKGGCILLLSVNPSSELRIVLLHCVEILQEVSLFEYFGFIVLRGNSPS